MNRTDRLSSTDAAASQARTVVALGRLNAALREYESSPLGIRLGVAARAFEGPEGERCFVWEIAPDGTRMRFHGESNHPGAHSIDPLADVESIHTPPPAWEPASGPIAQVLGARRPIEMSVDDPRLLRGLSANLVGTVSEILDLTRPTRAFGRFIPLFLRNRVAGVFGVVRAPGQPVFGHEDRVVLETAADRLTDAFKVEEAVERMASALNRTITPSNGVMLSGDLLARLGSVSGDVLFRHLFARGTEYISEGVVDSLGFTPAEVMADPGLLDRLIHPDDRYVIGELINDRLVANRPLLMRMHRRNGQLTWQLIRVLPIVDSAGRVLGVEGLSTDISAMKMVEAELAHQARSDGLTGLSNRLSFREATSRSLARLQRTSGIMGVLYLDLTGFKAVNDTFGHPAGDYVLQQVADRLRRVTRREDLVARLGGDEFAVLLSELRDPSEAPATARRVIEALERPYETVAPANAQLPRIGSPVRANPTFPGVTDEPISSDNDPSRPLASISTGVGIAITSNGKMTPDELVNRADIALLQSKRAGRGRWQIYGGASGSVDMTQGSLYPFEPEPEPIDWSSLAAQRHAAAGGGIAGLELSEARLRAAMTAGEFRVHYLPEFNSATGTLAAVEALVRWDHPELGLLPASAFIADAQRLDGIHSLGEWILREAARQVSEWRSEFHVPLTLWINVSSEQLDRPQIVESMLSTIAAVGLAPRQLGIDVPEITVNALNEGQRSTLDLLHRGGVRIAIDSFGTGSSSLQSLRQLPLSQIKLTRSLVDEVDQVGSSEEELIQLAIKLAGSLGAEVVAVGVERAAQLDRLRALECAYFQGYLAGDAKTAEQITAILQNGQQFLPGVATN